MNSLINASIVIWEKISIFKNPIHLKQENAWSCNTWNKGFFYQWPSSSHVKEKEEGDNANHSKSSIFLLYSSLFPQLSNCCLSAKTHFKDIFTTHFRTFAYLLVKQFGFVLSFTQWRKEKMIPTIQFFNPSTFIQLINCYLMSTL